ncbi:carboxypeptidase regulatory-like domain-containing protein [Paenibacillus campi]|uniref:carboxypeptidase regulatory-like domain-containing protein n=1 Tax=Paenibacillus campi TaxID=3106031 RepID=UPI002AFE17E5|nr:MULTISPECIES: carboxypeptidase regulatory-like domain-containing protein [unclassified Paenibacillus]
MKFKSLRVVALTMAIGIAGISPSALAQSSSVANSFSKQQSELPLATHVQPVTVRNEKTVSTQNIPLSHLPAQHSLFAANMLATATDNTYGSNTSPDTALLIQSSTTPTAVSGYIDQQGGARWYYTNISSALKLTAFMTVSQANLDYDLKLYRYNETDSTLQLVSYSSYGAGHYELLSQVATPGYYFISVTSYQGADTSNPFTLATVLSDSYDSSEPDDNPYFAKDRGAAFVSQQNIDNVLDEDWSKITLTKETTLNVRLNNPSANGDYVVYIKDANLQNLGSLKQNQLGQITLPAGSYYTQVYAPSKFDLTTPYTLSVGPAISRVAVSEITSDRGVQGFIDYGQGKKWRVGYNIVVKGRAFDKTGNPVASGIVSVKVQTRVGNSVFEQNGTTDSLGYFSIPLSIGAAAGQYTYRGPVSTHYYDIIPITFSNMGIQLNADINSLYHYAYSIR